MGWNIVFVFFIRFRGVLVLRNKNFLIKGLEEVIFYNLYKGIVCVVVFLNYLFMIVL